VHLLGHISDPELLHALWAHSGTYWHGDSVGGTNPALLQVMSASAPTLALNTAFHVEVLHSPEQFVLRVRGYSLHESVTFSRLRRHRYGIVSPSRRLFSPAINGIRYAIVMRQLYSV
jgi:hypothetical protein